MFLEKDLFSRVPDTVMAFGGGSLLAPNRMDVVDSSDYDIVAIVPSQEYPVSYNYVDASDGCKMDIIVRDPETLAFEVEEARRNGKASVLRMIAEGRQLIGCKEKGSALQKHMKEIVDAGPAPLTRKYFDEKLAAIKKNQELLAKLPEWSKGFLKLDLVHELGSLHLRAQQKWLGSGKMLGRMLLQEPDFKATLEKAYANDRLEAIDIAAPALYEEAEESLFPLIAVDKDKNRRAKFLVRYSDDYVRGIFKMGKPEVKDIARDFLGVKIAAVSRDLVGARFGRPSNEYFYALARVIVTMGQAVQAIEQKNPEERYPLLTDSLSGIWQSALLAEGAQPVKLKEIAINFADTLSSNVNKPFERVSPSSFRTKSDSLSNLIL